MLRNMNAADAITFDIDVFGDMKLSRSFRLNEFQSKDGAPLILVHPALIVALQLIRDRFGPITINSAYRTEAHNKAIGGAVKSLHMSGLAADIVAQGVNPSEVAKFAVELGMGGVRVYPTFTHVDVGAKRAW
jgi:uncharacterized protein YcbK (DUF882 family)